MDMKKRIFSGFLRTAALLLITAVLAGGMAFTAFPASAGGGAFKLGDPTGEGKIDVEDIVAIRDHILGKKILAGNALLAANADKKGGVDVGDIVAVRDHILGRTLIEDNDDIDDYDLSGSGDQVKAF